MTCGAGCENVSSTALRLTSRPVRHLSVTSSTLPVRAGDQRQSLSYLAANFTFGSHAGVLMDCVTKGRLGSGQGCNERKVSGRGVCSGCGVSLPCS